MIRMLLIYLGLFVSAALTVHALVLFNLPGQVMSRAIDRFEQGGLPLHIWTPAPRTTPETQTIVRPSPDLAYSICLFDLMRAPIAISAETWGAYGSLSLYDDATNNIFVANLMGEGETVEVRVTRPGIRAISPDELEASGTIEVIEMSGRRGVALIRRLAPSEERHKAAQALVTEGQCAPIGNM